MKGFVCQTLPPRLLFGTGCSWLDLAGEVERPGGRQVRHHPPAFHPSERQSA